MIIIPSHKLFYIPLSVAGEGRGLVYLLTHVNRPNIFIDENLFAEVRQYFPRTRLVEAWRGWTLKNKSIKGPLVIYQALNLRLPGSINLQPNLYKNMLLLQMKARKNQAVYTDGKPVRVN